MQSEARRRECCGAAQRLGEGMCRPCLVKADEVGEAASDVQRREQRQLQRKAPVAAEEEAQHRPAAGAGARRLQPAAVLLQHTGRGGPAYILGGGARGLRGAALGYQHLWHIPAHLQVALPGLKQTVQAGHGPRAEAL